MDPCKGLAVLGSTGSVGVNTLDVVTSHPTKFAVLALAAHSNVDLLEEQARRFRPRLAVLFDEDKAALLRRRLQGLDVEVDAGMEGLCRAATYDGVQMVMSAVVGSIGLLPTIRAVQAGIDVALANKETLVMAGPLVMDLAQRRGARVLPVDSEHSAVFQALAGGRAAEVERIVLTASGGPFRGKSAAELANVTVEEALRHPTWRMGPKITIDSATLFNKGLEMIEAHWLFGVEMARVEVVIHPQSIVHSMVEFADGSVLAQLSHSDMCFPIQYAVTWPDRVPNTLPPLDFGKLQKLEFAAPRLDAFPALNLARCAGQTGGTLPAVMNAANEVAVSAFLDRRIAFPRIWQLVEEVMNRHASVANPTLDAILEADRWARATAVETLSHQDR
jgi:1-deoxy-D-xylulose-5-phosphate reductoisomerase